MATPNNPRKANDVLRAHHAAAETAAFATTGGAMLLGLLAGAAQAGGSDRAAARHDATSQVQPPGADAMHDQAPPPAEDTPQGHEADSAPSNGALFSDFHPFAHASSGLEASASPAGSTAASTGAAPASDAPVAATEAESGPSIHAQQNAPLEPTQTAAADTHDAGSLLQDIGTSLTTSLDTTLSTLSQAVSSLTDAVHGIASAVSLPDLGHVTDSITSTVSSLTQLTASVPVAVADTLVGAAFEPHAAHATDTHGIADAPLLDASSLVPIAPALAPPHIGFMGQAHIDGHDALDGAFSALGPHHF